jgi:xanthine dehydrogenase accessory factor
MREILSELEGWQRDREDVALATIVGTHGSGPRSPGAHLGITRAGKMAGSVSSGCVDNDVYRRALEVLDHNAPVVASFSIGDASELGVGLSCGGSIDVLIERFGDADAWRAAREAIANATPAILAVALEPAAILGRRMAIIGMETSLAPHAPEVARVIGSIDAGLDSMIVEEARALLEQGGTRLLRPTHEQGAAAVFLEAVLPPRRLIVVGATDTARALARLAKVLGFEVVVVDARAAYARRDRVPDADELLCAWPADVLDDTLLDGRTSLVTLAHDQKLDVPALACALRAGVPYVGALGSRRTHEGRKQQLREMGFTDDEIARVHSPVGLDLGGRTAEEIALAILAEIVAVKHGRETNRLIARNERGNGTS